MNLIEQVSSELRNKNLKLVTAESCTGGIIAGMITSLAGSSDIFDRGFVTYSNQAKQDMLGVLDKILDEHGAVSAQCADAMVKGALEHSEADIALSVTGIAGPSGGTPKKPVGLVYVGLCMRTKDPTIEECFFKGNRQDIRQQTVEKALSLILKATCTI